MSAITVRRVAILGAGTTGTALAAHLTNLGFSVALMDATTASAAVGLEHVRPGLYVPEKAGEIRAIGFDEGIPTLDDADWIIEALPDRLAVKRELYGRIARYVRPDAIVTTCSASLPVSDLVTDLPLGFATRFLAAYFSIPTTEHYLVEVRSGSDEALARDFARFLATEVARRAVVLTDGSGGIAARYGVWCMLLGVHVAEKLRIEVEDVEAITGDFLRQKGTGIFGAVDRMGLDDLRDAAENLHAQFPGDRGARYLALPNSAVGLLARGWTGDKAGRGYFRREGRERLVLIASTMAYRQARDAALPGLFVGTHLPPTERLRNALAGRDEVGEFLREFLITALRYAEYLRESMGVSVPDFDRVLELGFGWDKGSFRLLDDLGIGAVRYYDGGSTWTTAGYVKIPEGDFASLKTAAVIDRGDGHGIHDLGDGIEVVSLAPGVLSPARVLALLNLLEGSQLQRFVLTSEAGDWPSLDLEFMLRSLRGDLPSLERYLANLQSLGERLEKRSVVAAVGGRCTGPSLGLALSCAGLVATAESSFGFDEARLGLVPTARGTAILRVLHGGSARRMGELAVSLAEGYVAANADLARLTGLIRPDDLTEYLPERLLETAKELARKVSGGPLAPFTTVEGPLVGIIDRGLADRRQRGALTDYDVTVGQRIRQILARTNSYDECLDLERKESLDLGGKALTQARIRHVIETGKTLRN